MDSIWHSGNGAGYRLGVAGAGLVGTTAVWGLRHDLEHDLIVEVFTLLSRVNRTASQ